MNTEIIFIFNVPSLILPSITLINISTIKSKLSGSNKSVFIPYNRFQRQIKQYLNFNHLLLMGFT